MNKIQKLIKDTEVSEILNLELERQKNTIELIASENFTSQAVFQAQGSVLTNKYAEGYPNARYYGGCEEADKIETLAINRAKELFECDYANVQPHSGSNANFAAYNAFLKPKDRILAMSLDAGGHLTHGFKLNQSAKFYDFSSYQLDSNSNLDYDSIEKQALECKPNMIVAGFSAYPKLLDWERFRRIADKVGAILMFDIAHIAGLVAGKAIESPIQYADIVTTTTHKTLGGPRSGLILAQSNKYSKQINSSVFPGIQGGPLMHVIAAKAICFKECLSDEFKQCANQIIKNAKAFADELMKNKIKIVCNTTECHLLIIDLRTLNVNGIEIRDMLEEALITTNQNSVPNDPLPPYKTSGIRIGTSAITTRGMKEKECKLIAKNIANLIHLFAKDKNSNKLQKAITEAKEDSLKLCKKFPIYNNISY